MIGFFNFKYLITLLLFTISLILIASYDEPIAINNKPGIPVLHNDSVVDELLKPKDTKDKSKDKIVVGQRKLFVDPDSSAFIALRKANNKDKNKLSLLANTPTGIWQSASSDINTFSTKINQARKNNQIPIVVLYAVPNIGCGNSGKSSVETYLQWLKQRAKVLDGTESIVILEPDSVAMYYCLNSTQLATRKSALNSAISELSKTDAKIYVDAGHSSWQGVDKMVSNLNTLNMGLADGISVNVSNFQTNSSSEEYVLSILDRLKNDKLTGVIDTSRNGNGPKDGQWCNPLGRKIGTKSVLNGNSRIAGYLWIKVPGESDGSGNDCNNGTKEGTFWQDYALDLVP